MPATDVKKRLHLAQVFAMPVLVTAAVAAMMTNASASTADYQTTSAPPVLKTAPVTKLKKKPIPLADRWVLPVHGYHLTARFGASSGLWAHNHTGLDFAAAPGTPIHSVTSGVVVSAGYAGAYGNQTIIRLKDGTELWYCHQTSITVSVGQKVMPGDVIGTVGSTGNVTGPHLHLEVRPTPDTPIDPYTALAKHGVHA